MKSQPVWIKCPVPADQSEVSSCWPATSPGQFSQHNVEGICTCSPLEWSVLKIDHFSEVVILTPPSSKSADFFCLALHLGASYRVWSVHECPCLRYQLGWSVWGVRWLYTYTYVHGYAKRYQSAYTGKAGSADVQFLYSDFMNLCVCLRWNPTKWLSVSTALHLRDQLA